MSALLFFLVAIEQIAEIGPAKIRIARAAAKGHLRTVRAFQAKGLAHRLKPFAQLKLCAHACVSAAWCGRVSSGLIIMETILLTPEGHLPRRGRRITAGKLTGQKPALKMKEVCAIRARLELRRRVRDLALFNWPSKASYEVAISLP